MLNYRRVFSVGGIVVMLAMLLGAAGIGWAKTAQPPSQGARIYDMKWLNINKWLCPFYNDGRYGIDITVGTGEAGGSWPQPFKNKYIFGAGLWFGSLKARPDDKVDTLVTFGYNPNSGGTEMTPTDAAHAEEGSGNPADRVYVFPGDWPPPADRYIQDSTLVPQENFSLQDMWCVYCDLGEESHVSPGKPQGIEIYQTVYAWNYPTNEDIFFIIYKARNAGDDTLRNCYMGAVVDPDIGVDDDDMVGLLLNDSVPGVGWVKNVGYAGDVDNHEVINQRLQWEEGTPGVVAYKFLESPKGPDGKPLGMTAFKKFTIDIDPVTDPAQYLTMAGYDYRTSVYCPYDSVDVEKADKRFVQCSGPFDLAPGQVEELIVATIAAPFGGEGQPWENRGIDSLVHLARVANAAQFIYDQGWLLPGPPAAPGITLVPGDNSVRIVWDNLSETTPDPYYGKVAHDTTSQGWDPKYLEYDFQGYIVYKSANGSDWSILTQCDLADTIPADTNLWSYPPSGDSSLPDSLWIKMTNSGLSYSVTDNNVINGFGYYYCVTAYDWNYVTTEWDTTQTPPVPIAWDTLILRSGIVSNYSMVPRWDAANYIDPEVRIVTVTGDTVNNGLACSSEVVIPFEVTADTYEIRFLGPEYLAPSESKYSYCITRLTDGSIVVDTTGFNYAVGDTVSFSVPVFNGQELHLSLNYETPEQPFDTIYVSGEYPVEKARPYRVTAGEQKSLWAFRGSDYRIGWTTDPGGFMTARVYDLTNDSIEVPFTPFDTRAGAKANGWCFVNFIAKEPTDTLKTGTAMLYICGGYFALNYNDETSRADAVGDLISKVKDGDVWLASGHKTEGTAPYYNMYQLIAAPGYSKTDSTYTLNVKVVPNPYIVFNQWEMNTYNRQVKFTHLPSECTIRIFTLSGDLVKVLEHKQGGEQPLEQGGTETWDLLNKSYQDIASGVYVYHVESDVGECTGKLVYIH